MRQLAQYLTYATPILFIPLIIFGPIAREQYAELSGTIALILYILTLLPSMIRRYGLHMSVGKPFVRYLLPIRRQLGIVMFVFAFVHYLGIKVIPTILYGLPLSFPLYQIFGAIALTLTGVMFATSNTWSTRKLKAAWKNLHRITYVAGLALAGHLIFSGINWQAVMIGGVMVLEFGSLLYAWAKK